MKKTKIIEVGSGKLQGYIDKGIEIYKGVPYAEPPVGDLRFNAPEPKKSWSGVLEATEFSPVAPQPLSPFTPQPPPPQSEENCLTLNVWTPSTDDKKRPVMFWIHGGSYKTGSADNYIGTPLVNRGDVVVVVINYRLGPLGFLYLPDAPNASANVGLLDQIQALKWVKENIAHFGGDPENVTAFGESAGAGAICSLLGMPDAKGLFNRIIPQSGSANPLGYQKGRAIATTQRLLSLLEIEKGDIDSLRKISAEEIIKAQTKMDQQVLEGGTAFALGYSPLIDSDTMPIHPLKAVLDGETKNIEVLHGTNKDEMRLWELWYPHLKNSEELFDRVNLGMKPMGQTEEKVREIINVYSEGRENLTEIYSAIVTDSFFRIPSIRLAEMQSKNQPDTYMYMFTYPSPIRNGSLGSVHAIEIPFVFGTLDIPRPVEFKLFPVSNKETEELSAKMMDSWISFARNGNPNHKEVPKWPQYGNDRATMMLGKDVNVINDPHSKERSVWEDIIIFKE
ncbi:MAG: carboxylesterase/lipase family protein [Promethearchaeota archaeon]|jgi:para-nitrobenzyl esterase